MTTKDVGKLSFNLDTIIGLGSDGTFVFKGICKDSALAGVGSNTINRTVAIKRIQKAQLNNGSNFQQEVEVMQKAGENQNILQLIWTETNNADYLYIATEFCNGTLEDYVTDKYNGGPMFMTEKEILRQLTKGLAHLHNLGIVHRDIKPTNILIFVSENGTELIKLADFNISKVLKSNKDFTNTNVTNPSGTRGWMDPEVYESERFDFKVDIYALGLIFGYTLSGGKHPFGDEDSFERIERIKKKEAMVMTQKDLKIPFSRDGVTFELIKSMLAESTKRPTIAQVEKNSFFKIDVDRTQKMLTLRKNKTVTESELTLKMIDFETMLRNETLDVHGTSSSITDTRTVLHFLCEYFNHYDLVELFQLLVQKGADVNAKDEFGRTPLHLLCYYYDKANLIDIVKSLTRKGADINAKTDHGMSPLHYLCLWYSKNNLVDLIRLLIEKDVEVDAMAESGSTPLLYLCENYKNENLIDILKLLTDKGVDCKIKMAECGRTPLHLLCANYGNVNLKDIADLLIRKGADINAKTTNGETPLHLLCRYYEKDNVMDIVKFFILKGAAINAMSKYGMTPADILRRRGFRV